MPLHGANYLPVQRKAYAKKTRRDAFFYCLRQFISLRDVYKAYWSFAPFMRCIGATLAL